jgi:cell division initiation protein
MSNRLSAMDIENQKFPRKLRGYAPEEVQMYLRSVAEEVQRLNLENDELREKSGHLGQKLKEIQARERTLQETLVSAQKMSSELKERARQDAAITEKEARIKAERILQQAQDQLMQIEGEIRKSKLEREAFESRIRAVIEEHQALLDLREQERQESDNLRFLYHKTGSEAG